MNPSELLTLHQITLHEKAKAVNARFLLACLFLVFNAAAPCLADVAPRPNILLILADDLGYSDLGCFGGEIETPNLDSLASNGVRLTHFYTTGRCCPSRAALLTGHYPHRVGLGHMAGNDLGQPGYRGRVDDGAMTLAETLSNGGYRTFMAGKWHLGTADPTKHGFEEFYGTLVSAKRFFDPDHLIRLPEKRTPRRYSKDSYYATDAITDHALDFLEATRDTPDKPFFLYLAYHAPHFPLQAPQDLINKYAQRYSEGWDNLRAERLQRMKQMRIVPYDTNLSARSRWTNYGETKSGTNPAWNTLPISRQKDLARRMAIYAAMVDRMDQQIGRVLRSLKDHHEFKNTLIIFTSDNGACFEWDPYGFDVKSSNQNILHEGQDLEQMGSRDTFHSLGSGWANACNTPWRLYKHFNHEGGIASPAIIHWPSQTTITPGSLHTTPAHLIDIYPTVLSVTQSQYQGKQQLPGINIFRTFTSNHPERMLFFEHQGNRAIRDGKWKLVALDDRPWELYDLQTDRTESSNLAAEHPEMIDDLNAKWEKWASENHVTPLPQDLKVNYLKPD